MRNPEQILVTTTQLERTNILQIFKKLSSICRSIARVLCVHHLHKKEVFFSQRKGNDNPDTFDKKNLKDKECYKCGDKEEPSSHCKTKLDSKGKKKKKKYDNTSSVSRKQSTHTMVGRMNKDIQKTKKWFAAMECMIKNIEEEEYDSDISDSNSESGSGVFQMERNIVSYTWNNITTKILLHNQAKLTNQLDLKNVIILDN